MAEKIISPGVFTNEIDQSFLPAAVQAIGAAVVGPTQKGPAMIPTRVSSYSEFLAKFGGDFSSGSGANEDSYKYLTNYSVQEYLKYADTLTVVRILAGDYGPASALVSSSGTSTAAVAATGSFLLNIEPNAPFDGDLESSIVRLRAGTTNFFFTTASATGNSAPGANIFKYSDAAGKHAGLVEMINASASAFFSASTDGTNLQLTASNAGADGTLLAFPRRRVSRIC